jgi:uncharacterized membrane protein YebE (DUF533 family)
MQEILAGIIVLGAVAYLGYRAYRSYQKKKCGDGDCGCK